MTNANLNVGSADLERINKIVQRYNDNRKRLGLEPADVTLTSLDLAACHLNGCPLDLVAMADPEVVDDFTLSHDVSGIFSHVDRGTGKLVNGFLPRCAVAEAGNG